MSTYGQMRMNKKFVAHDDEHQFVCRKIGNTIEQNVEFDAHRHICLKKSEM